MSDELCLSNRFVRIGLDRHGRVTSLQAAGAELIAFPEHGEAWRLVVPTGRHTVESVCGADQDQPSVRRSTGEAGESLALTYDGIRIEGERQAISVRLVWQLSSSSPDLTASVEVVNHSAYSIDEAEFPILGGIDGDARDPRSAAPGGAARTIGSRGILNLAAGQDRGIVRRDLFSRGLPQGGRESGPFVRELETVFLSSANPPLFVGADAHTHDAVWVDLWTDDHGLYAGLHAMFHPLFAFKLEKYPTGSIGNYPEGTHPWVRLSALHMPGVNPGDEWVSEPIALQPHAGTWHVGADAYSDYRHEALSYCRPPAWMDRFVGWTEIMGKTYLGEVFHDYRQCAEWVIEDAEVTGIDLVFYYGHTRLGCEGADFDQGPSDDLGGEAGFRAMVDDLHDHGIRLLVLDHLHRYVNRDVPEVESLGLMRYAVLDEEGGPVLARWQKETGLSCLFLAGPTPEWVEMCPSCDTWFEHYSGQVSRLIDLGVDGLEMDCFNPQSCWSRDHPHEPGAELFETKLAFTARLRAQSGFPNAGM